MIKINLALDNRELYEGCQISMVGGRLSLETPPDIASNIIGLNLQKIIDRVEDRSEVVLTGAMAVWSYLIAFHIVLHQFRKVWYDDGKGIKILIAAHG